MSRDGAVRLEALRGKLTMLDVACRRCERRGAARAIAGNRWALRLREGEKTPVALARGHPPLSGQLPAIGAP